MLISANKAINISTKFHKIWLDITDPIKTTITVPNLIIKLPLLLLKICYFINIESPNEKNLYLFFTASWYEDNIISFDAKADTSIISVDFGKWKLVIRADIPLNWYPG